jgi:multiple sugar transport system permease protein
MTEAAVTTSTGHPEKQGLTPGPSVALRFGNAPGQILKYGLLVFILLLLLIPFYEMFSTALKGQRALFVTPPVWFPTEPAWQNFIEIWTYVPLGQYFINSAIIAGGTTVLNNLAAIPAAFALARLRFPGRRIYLYIVLSAQMFSPVILLIAAFRLMIAFRLDNNYMGLILINATTTLPLTIWLLTGYFMTVPKEIEEAALIDGASFQRIIWSLYIPVARPGIVATVIFAFILAWNEFLFALTFTQDPLLRPLTLGIYSFIGRYQIQWNLLMAASLVAVLPVLALFLLVQRHLIEGLTAGAAK